MNWLDHTLPEEVDGYLKELVQLRATDAQLHQQMHQKSVRRQQAALYQLQTELQHAHEHKIKKILTKPVRFDANDASLNRAFIKYLMTSRALEGNTVLKTINLVLNCADTVLIQRWLVEVGDYVLAGQAVLETDQLIFSWPVSGFVGHMHKQADDSISPEDNLCATLFVF